MDYSAPRETSVSAEPGAGLFLEDLTIGQVFDGTKTLFVSADDIRAFAARFDPQPFHMEAAAGAQSVFAGQAASGWHTASMTMRLLVEGGPLFDGGNIGLEVNGLRWSRPTLAGDTLRIRSTIEAMRRSKSNPLRGLVTLRTQTLNQRGEVVQEFTSVMFVKCRSEAAT